MIVLRGDRDFYSDLFTLKDFDAAIAQSPDHVNTANAGTKKKATTYSGSTARGIQRVLSDMWDGHTLMLDRINERNPKLALFCRILGPELGRSFQTNAYLTPPHSQGYFPHWDNHEVFILQVMGSKRWKIEKRRRAFPGLGDKMGEEGRELRGDIYSFTLEQGDLIYIPRGFVHAADCGEDPSLHITLGIRPFFLEELLAVAIKAAVQRDERWRTGLPLGIMRGHREQVVRRAVTALREIADETLLALWSINSRRNWLRPFRSTCRARLWIIFSQRPLSWMIAWAPAGHRLSAACRRRLGSAELWSPKHRLSPLSLKKPCISL